MEKRRELKDEYREKVAKKLPDQLWSQWKKCFPILTNFVNDLYNRMEIYTDLVNVVKANPKTLEPPALFIWLRDNYVVAQSMALRRLLDVDERSMSLGRLLREIEIRPELITKARFQELVKDKMGPQDAARSFRAFVGSNASQIKLAMATADIERLETAEKNIRKLVNKRFAHASPFTKVPNFPVFEEIENAVEEIDQVVVKYDSFIYGGLLSTAHSVKLNWKQPLEFPWIERKSRGGIAQYAGPQHRKLNP